ncbi:SHOCT domain-containing protein [Rhodococcus zopfii]|uniref:SHOCT domain-containing protein n=1 Tax=Rhodococcus zopfii TaxID=43772 RepID=UPI00111138F8|nr:SHOCT domain-containing protein [Rhodococcus zopfii]
MPGLLRGVARTAVIAGTATSVSNRVSRRQGRRWAQQDQEQHTQAQQQAAPPPPPPAPPASGGVDRLEALKQLGELKTQGVLTDAEFEAEKARILAG